MESFEASHAVWWLSKSEWPRASNRRVLQPYSPRMEALFANGYETPRPRPSGHDIGDKFSVDNSAYLRYCRDNGIRPHPARFPSDLPEYFIRMLTDPGDMVFDPFGGSCVTGEVAERLERRWVCSEIVEEYLRGAVGPLRWTA